MTRELNQLGVKDDAVIRADTGRESDNAVGVGERGLEFVGGTGLEHGEEFDIFIRIGEIGLEVVAGNWRAIDAENLPECILRGGRSFNNVVINVVLPSRVKYILKRAKHRAVNSAVSVNDIILVAGQAGAITIIKENPARRIPSLVKRVMEIEIVVSGLDVRVVDARARDLNPADRSVISGLQ